MKGKTNLSEQFTDVDDIDDVDVDKMFPRVSRSVLSDLINLARKKYPNAKEKIHQWQIEDMLGELYDSSKSQKQDDLIFDFASKNKLMITEALTEEEEEE